MKKKKKREPFDELQPPKEQKLVMEGEVVETLPNGYFRVKLDKGPVILAYVSGKMRIHYVRLLRGDRVRVEVSPYDPTKGRIVYRLDIPQEEEEA